MAIEQLPGQCWVYDPKPDDYEGDPHFESKAAALADDYRPAGAGARQQPSGCFTVTCDGECGDQPEDDEYGWNIHCTSRAEAERFALSCGWIVTRDGGVFCADDAPEGADLAMVDQVPGQFALSEEESTDA